MAMFVVFSGILMDKLIKTEKISTTLGRKLSVFIGFGSEAVIVIVLGFVRSYTTACFLLIIGEGLAGLGITGYKVNPVDLAPQYASVLTGIVRLGVLGATISTALAGALRQKNAESWEKILLITGSVHFFAVIMYCIFGSGKQQHWAYPVYEKLVSSKSKSELDQKYGSTSKTSDRVHMNGAVFNEISFQNGSVSHFTLSNEHHEQ